MPVDIRATVSCSLGTVISGSISDEYVQGTGLIKCSGSVVINAIITPAVGTAVTFTYTKSGVTRSIPRKLRVLSSFADPFRRTTSIELGCKLTYLSDKRDSIDWTAFDDAENTLTADDAKIITIPIRAQAVAAKCMAELGITGTFTLTNQFSIAQFDLSPGYVQVLSDLLVSESLCGYLDANETLQVFSLDQAGGTGPVLDATQLVDIGKIGVGSLPGEAVVVSYSSLKLKRDVNQGQDQENAEWDTETTQSRYFVDIAYGNPDGGAFGTARYNILETTVTTTTYQDIVTSSGEAKRVVGSRWTQFRTGSPSIAGGLIAEYLSNGIGYFYRTVIRNTYETFDYDAEGNERLYTRLVRGDFAFLVGSASVPFVFSDGSYVTVNETKTVNLEKEERLTLTSGNSQLVRTTLWGPWFKSIPGQQSIAKAFPAFANTGDVIAYLNVIGEGDLAIIDKRTEIQRKSDSQSAPSLADVNNAANADGGNPNNGYRTESKAELQLALGSATAQRRIELSLPYAPDDTFIKTGSVYSSIESDAPQKAQRYGIVQNRLLLGNRNGMSLQTSPEVLPGAPFAPFLVRSGSTSALYRTNGTSWTFDAQGLVVSTDALFWGGVGGNAGESWFPIAPGITTLPTTPPTTTVNIVDANGNVVGSYEQTTVTGTVPVAQETRLLQSTLRVRPVVTAMGFAMQEMAEVAITSRLRAVVSSIKAISVPATEVTVAGLTPEVSTGVRVLVPVATVQVAAQTPAVSSGASVAAPATGITVAGVVPDVVGRLKTTVTVPVATVQLAGLAPLVASGASVAVPAASISVAGLAPAQVGVEKDPDFASVSLLLRMDGSNGSTTFTDSSTNAHTITVFGNAQVSTADPKFGTGALTLDGDGDYLRTPADADFSFGTGNLTVECWCKPDIVSGNDGLFTFGGLFVALFQGNWYLGTTGSGGTNMGSATASSWQHVAVTRTGSNLRLFINGTQKGSTLTDSTNLTSNQLFIGYYFGAIYTFDGLIDEFRVTKGVSRYTSNFTAPTAPFPGA